MAGAKVKMGLALAACLAVLFQVCSAATSHVVGDSTGWTIPSTTSFYSSWASEQTFLVGDFLVFDFVSGAHTVGEVTKADYDSCSSTSPITLLNNGPANLTISSPGTHYYICTISGHCSAGQKLSITASAAPSTSSPAPKSSTSAPSPKSTATPPTKSTAAPTPKSTASPTASPPTTSTAAPTPKSTASPTASPPTTSSAAAPPPSSGAPTPTTSASSPSPASAPGPSGAGSPETAPTPSTSGGPASSPSPATGGSLSPPEPSLTPTEAPSSTPASDSPAASAGLVLPLVVLIGAIFLN